MGEIGRWARDWAVVGGITGFVGPLLVSLTLLGDSGAYAATTGVLGAMTGAGVGVALHEMLQRAPGRTWIALCATVVPVALGAWGGVVAGLGAWLHYPDLVAIAVPVGSVAAALQVGWMAPVYAALARRGGWRMPVLVPAALLAAPLVGMAGAVVGLMIPGLARTVTGVALIWQ